MEKLKSMKDLGDVVLDHAELLDFLFKPEVYQTLGMPTDRTGTQVTLWVAGSVCYMEEHLMRGELEINPKDFLYRFTLGACETAFDSMIGAMLLDAVDYSEEKRGIRQTRSFAERVCSTPDGLLLALAKLYFPQLSFTMFYEKLKEYRRFKSSRLRFPMSPLSEDSVYTLYRMAQTATSRAYLMYISRHEDEL